MADKLVQLGLGFEHYKPKVMTKMAFGMFDTQTNHRCDILPTLHQTRPNNSITF